MEVGKEFDSPRVDILLVLSALVNVSEDRLMFRPEYFEELLLLAVESVGISVNPRQDLSNVSIIHIQDPSEPLAPPNCLSAQRTALPANLSLFRISLQPALQALSRNAVPTVELNETEG